jgi:hypothetical protein
MPIHLVTFASPRFRHRQLFLGWSASANGVANSVTHWTPSKLLAAGFENRCPTIRLSERGSGFYAWKPFIIQKKLEETPEGDIIFYCDVGRTFPYKLLSGSLQFFLDWMKAHEQSVMPGIQIPWGGPMSMWTKRDAFVSMSMDTPSVHAAAPIQASFSIWINGLDSKEIVAEWMNLSAQRQLISDDPSVMGLPELSGYKEHRHDQSLLSLVCLKQGIQGMDIGCDMPPIDAKHPSEVAELLSGKTGDFTAQGRLATGLASVVERLEWTARKWIKFNEPQARPDAPPNEQVP